MNGQEIRMIREQLELSQRDFAPKIGVSQKTVWAWESGKSEPSSEYVERLTTLSQNEVVKGSQIDSEGSQIGSQGSQNCINLVDTGSQKIVKSDNEGSQGSQNEVVKVVKNEGEVVKTGSQNSEEETMIDKFNPEYIKKVIEFLGHKEAGGITEVRIFPKDRYLFINGRREYVGKTVSGYYDDYVKLAQDVQPFDGKASIYVTINPVKPALLARYHNRLQYNATYTTSDNDILCDWWYVFDADPIRAAEISSTDDELQRALERRDMVSEFLSRWGVTVKAMSGNGGHGLIRLTGYPNNSENRKAKERLTHFLSGKFSDEDVSIDNTVFNFSRIWKLYGTLATKGDDMPDRPHRRSYLELPDQTPKPVDLYAYLDEIIPTDWTPKKAIQSKQKVITPNNGNYPKLDVPAYLDAWGGEWRTKEKDGVIWYQFEDCPVHNDPDNDKWECGICQYPNGQMGAKCMHENYTWQDFKEVLGDPKPFYEKIQRPKQRLGAVPKTQIEMQIQTEEPAYIHLTDIEKAEYEGLSVITDVLLPGVGRDDSFFVPKKVEVTCSKEDKEKCDGCPLIEEGAYTYEFADDDRRLIRFTKQTDEQVRGEIRKALFLPKKCSEYKFNVEDYTEIQILLAVPKAGAELRKEGGKFVDEHGRDFREKVIYYSGVVPRSNAYYQVQGAVVADPKSQRATMLANRLVKLQNEYEQFTVTENAKALLRDFQTEDLSAVGIDSKMRELGRDIAYNIAHYFGEPRVNIVIADMLVWHSVLQFPFDGDMMTKGWIDLLIFGDSGINKTTHLRKLRNAIDFGYFVDGGAVSRAGLLYSLDDVHSGIRILRWGALPLNDGQLVIIDESQNISLDVWQEMSSARTTGLLTVTKAKHGEHPMRSRQIYTANPKPPNTMSSFSFPIRGIKDLMRPADMRRFDIVICAARGEVEVSEVNRLQAERGEIVPHKITPEHLKASIARAWTRRPEHIVFSSGAEAAVMDMATKLQKRFGCGDIPVIDIDAKDKVARGAVAVATMLNSTDETFEPVIVKPGHAHWIGMYLMGIYSAQAAMLDKHAQVTGKMERIADMELDTILQEWQQLNPPEPEHLAEMAILIAEGEGIERDVLAAQVGITPQQISTLIQKFKQHRFVKSTRKGYYATPRLVRFYREKYDELSNLALH